MALVIHWYDFACFAIVAGAVVFALWMLKRKEGCGKCDYDQTMYESLLIAQSDRDGFEAGEGLVRRSGHLVSTQLWTTCWRGVHPVWLLATRMLSAAVMITLLSWDVRSYDSTIFLYYTEWTFTLVIVYFVVGTIVSAHGCWTSFQKTEYEEGDNVQKRDLEECNGSSTTISFRTNKIRGTIKLQSHWEQEETAQRAGFWGYLMQTIYQTCAGAVMITDIVFWFLIVPFLSIEHFTLNLLMGCMHTFNLALLLLDTSLNSLPFPWFRLSYFILWSCLYVTFQWVVHACGMSWWPYPFLELSTPWAPVWYLCLAVVHIPCYGIYALIEKAKNAIFSKCFPNAYIKSN
ncbi:uncharacterized protein LOC122057852 [Macadamia integrifolia]|uniref:uncharacterized protein LOC122057852 n=1 Tax=Macadamia integrifolia TaxID=60698 RepID=UPI001C52D170|nr:uncharacterized protein LOC122057852 [Macadamia integrifolia]